MKHQGQITSEITSTVRLIFAPKSSGRRGRSVRTRVQAIGRPAPCDLKADAPADVLGRAAEQEGWLFKVKLSNHDEIEKLLSKEDYLCLVDSCK